MSGTHPFSTTQGRLRHAALWFAGVAIVLAMPTRAAASITSTSGNAVYVDSSNAVNPKLLGNYVSFNVTNDTGSAIPDAWVTICSFTGAYVALALHENGIAHLGPMSAGQTLPVFFYVNVDCSSFGAGHCDVATAQGFTVQLYSGPPTSTLVQSQSFSVTVVEAINANANTISTIVTSSNSPGLGTLITVTVTGSTGTIGSAKVFCVSPQTYYDFPATSFRLYGTGVVPARLASRYLVALRCSRHRCPVFFQLLTKVRELAS